MSQEGGNANINTNSGNTENGSTVDVNTAKAGAGQEKKKSKAVTIIIIVVVVAIIGGVAYYLTHRNTAAPETPEEALERGVITEENVDQIMEQIANSGPANISYYTVTMNTEWHFENGKADSYDAYVENSTKNNTPVYFDVFLASDEENPIYQSPVIPLGKQLDKIKLDKELDPGTYDCVLIYHLIDDDQNTLSTLRIAITIVVEG